MHVRRLMFPAALTLVAVLTTAGFASAAPDNGAIKEHREYCTTSPNGTACFELNTVFKTTVTPSGNTIVMGNGETRITNDPTFTTCNFVGGSKFHDVYLLKDGQLHQRGDHEESYLERHCGTVNEICTFTRRAHRVDGTYQYLIEDFRCTPL